MKIFSCLKTVVLGLAIVGTTGCASSFALRDANDQLTTLYQQANNGSNDAMVRVNARAGLTTLASDAAAQADKVSGDENKISFYRVAVTAAWQSQSPDLKTYADKGNDLCSTNGNAAKVPRDCGMLMVFPQFAAIDQLTLAWNALAKPTIAQVTDTYTGYDNRLAKLIEQRSTISAMNADPLLTQGIDQRIGQTLCGSMFPLVGSVLLVSGGTQALQKQFACKGQTLLQALKTAGVNSTSNEYSCASELAGWTGC